MSNELNTNEDPGEGPAKRHAQKGQWQTPPAIVFPSTTVPDNTMILQPPEFDNAAALGDILLGSLSAPQSSDDIAKALQEAYRRGQEAYRRKAEAAAAVSSAINVSSQATVVMKSNNLTHPHGHMIRKPNLNIQSNPDIASLNIIDSTKTIIPPASRPDLQHATCLARGAHPMIADANRGNPIYYPPQQISKCSSLSYNPITMGSENNHNNRTILKKSISTEKLPQTSFPSAPQFTSNRGSLMLPSQMVVSNLPVPEINPNIPGVLHNLYPRSNLVTSGDKCLPLPSRSVSLPDISTYAAQNSVEEQKRLKRLERNRASARLRRLKKKNLVDSYEVEVGILECSLAKLRAHRWGVGSDIEALLEALSMDRGQQVLDTEKRKEILTSLITQQLDQVKTLMECQEESMILGLVSRYDPQQGSPCNTDPELMSLVSELDNLLHLSDNQKKQLSLATNGCEDEYHASETIDTCLSTLLATNWLMNNGIEECTKPFTSILNTGQMSKFLLWADHNSDAIDQLDFVNAPPANAPPAKGPIFIFGIDDAGQGDEGDEK